MKVYQYNQTAFIEKHSLFYQVLNCSKLVINNLPSSQPMPRSDIEQQMMFTIDTIFKKYDLNRNGLLEPNEVALMLQDAFNQMGTGQKVTSEKVKLFISRLDQDGDEKLNKQEMLAAILQSYCGDF